MHSLDPVSSNAYHILVVEDDESVRDVIVQLLRRWGYTVVAVASGSAAVAQFAATRFDLVCTDLTIPDMSGWDIAAHARTHNQQIAILLITGWAEQISRDEAQHRGIDQVLIKPFRSAVLHDAVVALLAARHDDRQRGQ